MPDHRAILNSSTDRNELLKSAVFLARSNDANDLAALMGALSNEAFFHRLDSEEDYRKQPESLRLASVLNALSRNASPAAHEMLSNLTKRTTFLKNQFREQVLIQALVNLRPLTPAAVSYLDERSTESSVFLHLIIDGLCENGSDPAMALLEKRMKDPGISSEIKILWLHKRILMRRYNPQILKACKDLLSGAWEFEYKSELIRSLFDYRVEWYRSYPPPAPPPITSATPRAKELLREIARLALDQHLAPEETAKLEAFLKSTE